MKFCFCIPRDVFLYIYIYIYIMLVMTMYVFSFLFSVHCNRKRFFKLGEGIWCIFCIFCIMFILCMHVATHAYLQTRAYMCVYNSYVHIYVCMHVCMQDVQAHIFMRYTISQPRATPEYKYIYTYTHT